MTKNWAMSSPSVLTILFLIFAINLNWSGPSFAPGKGVSVSGKRSTLSSMLSPIIAPL